MNNSENFNGHEIIEESQPNAKGASDKFQKHALIS